MKLGVIISLALILETAAIGSDDPGQGPAGVRLGEVKAAIAQRLCYEAHWLAEPEYRRGVVTRVQMALDGERFYARVGSERAADYTLVFVGTLQTAGSALLFQRYGSADLDFFADLARVGYQDMKGRVSPHDVMETSLRVPDSCQPAKPYDATKKRMVDVIVATLEQVLQGSPRLCRTSLHPKDRLELIIADFSPEYPNTYVLVRPCEDIYEITLHEPTGVNEQEYQKNGYYLFRVLERGSVTDELPRKIRRQFISRTISVNVRDKDTSTK